MVLSSCSRQGCLYQPPASVVVVVVDDVVVDVDVDVVVVDVVALAQAASQESERAARAAQRDMAASRGAKTKVRRAKLSELQQMA
jgi:hypothetical protein